MPVTYTNRKGRTYVLCRGMTKTGITRYYFAREPKGEPVERIPDGYRISESVNGIVSLVKDRPSQVRLEEVALVENEIDSHPQRRNYQVRVGHDRIVVYEMNGPSASELSRIFKQAGFLPAGFEDRSQELLEQTSSYSPVLQFILSDPERRRFRMERWCYLGSIDDWIDIQDGPLEELVSILIPRLGTESFFDIY